MSKLQKAKRSFRQSKKWKDFRHKMNVAQKGIALFFTYFRRIYEYQLDP